MFVSSCLVLLTLLGTTPLLSSEAATAPETSPSQVATGETAAQQTDTRETAAQQAAAQKTAKERNLEVDFLVGYYDQDGDHSPVTGGIGTEDQQVVEPVFLVRWKMNDKWSLNGALGVDNITSASTDNIDTEVSSASRLDSRVFTNTEFVRSVGDNQQVGFSLGFSKEYDYTSTSLGLSWARNFNQNNTTFYASASHYADEVELYDIDGIVQGTADRDTTDLSIALTQVLSKKTVGTIELSYSMQDGFLSTPFHEVILAPTGDQPTGGVIAERLPDSRERLAFGLRLNHAFSNRVVQRFSYRFYDDDFDVQAQTIEAETHFRLPTKREAWIFPILRFHTQDGSSYFGLPGTFTLADNFFTADRDLSGFDSEKYGFGTKIGLEGTSAWFAGVRDFEFRVTRYERDDGLEALNTSFGFGWSF